MCDEYITGQLHRRWSWKFPRQRHCRSNRDVVFCLRTSNLPVQPVKVQPFLTATTSASFLQSSLLQGAAWSRIRWKYWPSSFPLSHYSMNGIDYIAILQTGSTGHFTLFWFVVKAHNFDGFGLVQCPPVFPIRTPVFKLSLLSRLHHELPAVCSASWTEEIHGKDITDLNQRSWFLRDLIECPLLELQQSLIYFVVDLS